MIDEIEPCSAEQGHLGQSECPIGLIGDDIEAVSKKKAPKSAKTIVPVRCEASAACPSRWATTSPTTPSATGCSTKSTASVRRSLRRRRHHRRLQHRRRRLVQPHPAGGNGPARDRPVVRRRHHRRAGNPEGQAQPAALLPLDELHQPAHGREVRHSLGGIQLLRPDQDRREPARDRQPLRRHHQGQGRRSRDRPSTSR